MILESEETKQFYKIWMPLLRYVNEKLQIVPTLSATEPFTIRQEDAFKIRNKIWHDESLRRSFIAENPAGLSQKDLALVDSWQYHVKGKFFILRHLKKYSVFLSEASPSRAYAVLGLVSPIDEIVGDETPLLVDAVLLPFGNRIIYDSILNAYPIHFGGGISRDLKRQYRLAEEREGIVASLLELHRPLTPEQLSKRMDDSNGKLLNVFRKELYKSGLSPKMVEQHSATIETFGKSLINAGQRLFDIDEKMIAGYLAGLDAKHEKAAIISLKRFITFLLETDRIDYEVGWDVKDFLKVAAKSK